MVSSSTSTSSESPKVQKANSSGERRKSRWGERSVPIPGLATQLPQMNEKQQEIYILQLKIEESRAKLKKNDLGISPNPDDRSPSPEPIYNNLGQRINTREMRTRKKLESNLQESIQKLQELYPEYNPPSDCKQQAKFTSKVFIPSDKYPHINFVGLCIGPRGMTLKQMEEETESKIIIRGKGSVKAGKLGGQELLLPGADEPLHAYITSNTHESIQKAQNKINSIIREAIDNPDDENSLRSSQMTQLAILNGTVVKNKDLLGKVKEASEAKEIFTNRLICSLCGGTGHLPQDCKFKDDPENVSSIAKSDQINLNSEYMSLMQELNKSSSSATTLTNADGTKKSSNSSLPSVQSSVTGNSGEVAFCNWQDLFQSSPAAAALTAQPSMFNFYQPGLTMMPPQQIINYQQQQHQQLDIPMTTIESQKSIINNFGSINEN